MNELPRNYTEAQQEAYHDRLLELGRSLRRANDPLADEETRAEAARRAKELRDEVGLTVGEAQKILEDRA